MRLPKNYVDKIRAVPGVRAATWANWFGGQDPRDKTIFFGAFAVDAKSYLEVYPEFIVSPEGEAATSSTTARARSSATSSPRSSTSRKATRSA